EEESTIEEIQAIIGEEIRTNNYRGPDSGPAATNLILSHRNHTQEVLQDRFGNSLPLYRKVGEDRFRDMKDGNRLFHEPLESWTVDPRQATRFKPDEDGVILRREIPIDNIWSSRITNPGFLKGEREVVVGSEASRTYEDREIVPRDEFDHQENAEWALEILSQPSAT
ncbi:MAG: hypothetical protein ABEJ72_10725, partial [Candidatus Aenigmatarchaeota archaeon]